MFTSIMPNSVPLWGVMNYMFINQMIIYKTDGRAEEKPFQNEKSFIRMNYPDYLI